MLNVFFPKFCTTCTKVLLSQEELLCSYCLSTIPLTGFHFHNSDIMQNKFYGLLPIQQATALMYFIKKEIPQKLLHKLKYEGYQNIGTYFGNVNLMSHFYFGYYYQNIGTYFGKWLGCELKRCTSYQDIQVVVPVPLHKKRFLKRGYNQVEKFAKQIALQLEAEYCTDSLVKISSVKSQVHLGRRSRWRKEKVFSLKKTESIKNKHVLLVDDLITTGATLVQCGKELLKAPVKKLSVATLAMT